MKNKIKYKCETSNCRNKILTARKCSSCRCAASRAKDPEKYSYYNLKNNAKGRGINFELTLEQFRQFCVETDYIIGKGIKKHSYTIDRIENDKGYTIDNIRILSNSANASKGTKKLEFDPERGGFTVTSIKAINQIGENPF